MRNNLDGTPQITVMPVPAILDKAVAAHADRPALDFLGHQTTYAQLAVLVDRAARGFQLLGVTKGTRVGLCLPNTPFSVICYFYCVIKQAIVV